MLLPYSKCSTRAHLTLLCRSFNAFLSGSQKKRGVGRATSAGSAVPPCSFGGSRPVASSSSRIHIPCNPFHLLFPNFLARHSSRPPGYGSRFSSKYPSFSNIMLCKIQQVVKASLIADWSRRLLKFLRNRKRIFKMPKTPSMSLRTDSTFFD
jgi:hypothetical protein